MLSHAYATVGPDAPGALELLRGVGAQVAARVEEFNAHELTLTLWSMAVVGALDVDGEGDSAGRRAIDAAAAVLPHMELNSIDQVRLLFSAFI